MKRRILTGLAVGAAAGIADVIPMLAQSLPWDANLSAFTLWLVVGVLLAVTDIRLKPAVKGIALAFLCLLPSAVLIGWKEPISLLPVSAMTALLGALAGAAFERLAGGRRA